VGKARSGYNKGTIRGDLRYLVVSKDVRRHRLISIDYVTTLPVTAEVASSSFVVPAVFFSELQGSQVPAVAQSLHKPKKPGISPGRNQPRTPLFLRPQHRGTLPFDCGHNVQAVGLPPFLLFGGLLGGALAAAATIIFHSSILPDVNRSLRPDEQVPIFANNFRIFEILQRHSTLFPTSPIGNAFYILLGCAAAAIFGGLLLTIPSLPVRL